MNADKKDFEKQLFFIKSSIFICVFFSEAICG